MKISKLLMILALSLILTCAAGAEIIAGNEYKDTWNGTDLSWELDDEGTVTISGTGTIPYYMDGWDDIKDSIKKAVIKDGVSVIGSSVFADCKNMTDIELPDSIRSISYGAFYGCSSLTDVYIPDGVTSIGGLAFDGCSSLTSVDIPDGVTSIEHSLFSGCSSLTSVDIPEGVTSIGGSAFYGCSSLTSVDIPDGITDIPEYLFLNCSSLTSVDIPEGVTGIGNYAFYGCSSLTDVDIPEDVTGIGKYAFYGCSSLTSAFIPDGVTGIGEATFYSCSRLTRVDIPDSVTDIGEYAFSGCSSLTGVDIPDGVTGIGEGAFSGCRSLTGVVIPEGVTGIGNAAFSGCSSLTSVVIPEGVTSIGASAFSDCSSLKSAAIPNSVTSIKEGTFYGCSSLMSVVVPESVTSIGYAAFSGCSSLKSVDIPDSTTGIKEDAFDNNTTVRMRANSAAAANIAASGSWIYFDIESPTAPGWRWVPEKGENGTVCLRICGYSGSEYSVVMPDSIDGVPARSIEGFECGDTLLTLTLPDGLTDISYTWLLPERLLVHADSATAAGIEADDVNRVLESPTAPGWRWHLKADEHGDPCLEICGYTGQNSDINIPDSIDHVPVRSIGNYVFEHCESLESVNIPDGVTSIGDSAFYHCSSLKNVNIPDGMTSIGDYAFEWCENLKSVVLPDSVTSIGELAFRQETTITCRADSHIIPLICETLIDCRWESPAAPGWLWMPRKSDDGIALDLIRYKGSASHITVPAEIDGVPVRCLGFMEEDGYIGDFAITDAVTFMEIPEGITGLGYIIVDEHCNLGMLFLPKSLKNINELWYHCLIGCWRNSRAASWANANGKGDFIVYRDDINLDVYRELMFGDCDGWYANGTICLSIARGQQYRLVPSVYPEEALGEISYSSSNAKIATVDGSGLITAIKEGKCTITAKLGKLERKIEVTVFIALDEFRFAEEKVILSEGETMQTKLVVVPGDLKLNFYYWSEDDWIASVDEKGVISAWNEGTTYIHAESGNGSDCAMEVNVCGVVESVRFENETIDLIPGQQRQLKAIVTINGRERINEAVILSSSDSGIATVDADGSLKALGPGTAVITASAYNGMSTCCTVNVADIDTLMLPADTEIIEEEAFAGVPAESVVIPEGATVIASRAFAESSIRYAFIPDSVKSIAPDAFEGCEGLSVYCSKNSRAAAYAEKNGYEIIIE